MSVRSSSLLVTVAWGAMMIAACASAQTRPTGGAVQAGQATIGQTANGLLITQGSDRAVIDWNSFSVGQGGLVDFQNGDGATLNRVTGDGVSHIDGRLTASGSVYVMNDAGVVIGATGVVDVGGTFVASTLDVSNADFMNAGDLLFAGDSVARVVNFGRIGALGGDVALIGARVENRGTIIAQDGTAALAAGYEVLMRDAALADGQFVVRLGGDDTQALNAGRIDAAAVELRANQGNVLALAGNTDGLIRADGVRTEGGRIFLTAPGGQLRVESPVVAPAGDIILNADDITLSGRIDVSATAAPGGSITVEGQDITLGATALLDAAGTTGGLIRIGGDLQGGAVPGFGAAMDTATDVTVATGARVLADGTAGQGGDIVLWADEAMTFRGAISATGAGNAPGGFAEVSGGYLLYAGTADLRSDSGDWGDLLLDPYNIVISTAASSGMAGFTANAPNSVLNATVLTNALSTANVNVFTGSNGAQAGNITVNAALSWTSAGRLTLTAANNININRAITAPNGGLLINAGGTITPNANVAVDFFSLLSGEWFQQAETLPLFEADDFRIDPANSTFDRRMLMFTGFMDEPFVVDVYGLQGIASHSLLNNYIQVYGEIDATGTANWNGGRGFLPIGTTAAPFTGSLVGYNPGGECICTYGGYILGLTINRPGTSNVGLIGYSSESRITDIAIIDANITGNNNVGTFIGFAEYPDGSDVMPDFLGFSFATGTVTAQGQRAGGLIGYGIDTDITDSWARVNVTGATNVGGVIGEARFRTLNSYTIGVMDSFALGNVTALAPGGVAGGLIGYLNLSVGYYDNITTSYASGRVIADVAGGLVGRNVGGIATQVYWDTQTTGQNVAVGDPEPGNDLVEMGATGLTSLQARDPASYVGFDYGFTWYGANSIRPLLNFTPMALIYEPEQLQLFDSFYHYSSSYDLMRDMYIGPDLANPSGIWGPLGWLPIGRDMFYFEGYLYGNGHVIDGLYINRPNEDQVGMFGYIYGWEGSEGSGGQGPAVAEIQDLMLTNVDITGRDFTGGLVGYYLEGAIAQVYISGTVSGRDYTGGLVGAMDTGRLMNIGTFVDVSGRTRTGGLAGAIDLGVNVFGSYAQGDVSGANIVGGLVGSNSNLSEISQSFATGAVTGTTSVGGLVGVNEATVAASFWDRTTTGRTNAFGQNTAGAQTVSGLTTAQFQDTDGFINRATQVGWNFFTDWAPSAPGYYPANYLIEPVVYLIAGDVTRTYGASNAGLTVTGSLYGGPNDYVFGPYGDTLGINSADILSSLGPTLPVGFYRYGSLGGVTSDLGQPYRIVSTGGIDITPAPLTVTFDDMTKIYGDADPTLTFDVTGFVNGEGTSILTGALARRAGENVGSYAIRLGTLSAGSNYTISVANSAALTITPRTLSLVIDDTTKIYGDEDPDLTYLLLGFAFDDGMDLVTGNLVRQPGEDVGSYSIGVGSLSAGRNYTIAISDGGGLLITPRSLTIAADDLAMFFGTPVPDLTYAIIDGQLVFGDDLTGALATGAITAPGIYTIRQGTLTAGGNYDITFLPGELTVRAARQPRPDPSLRSSTDDYIPIDFDQDPVNDPFFAPEPTGNVGPTYSTGATDTIVDQLQQATAYCSVIGQSEYVVDCISERLAVIAASLPESGDYADARAALNAAAGRLAELVSENEETDFPANLTRSLRPDAPPSSRPLRPVRTDNLAATLAAASGILAETQTQLLRSSAASEESIHYQRIATAVGSTNTILLRSS